MRAFEKKALQKGFELVIGIDEAGRGPLAGPVVASAVSLRTFRFKTRISDSKKLSPRQREEAFHEIFDQAYVGVGIISEAVIDEINILEATFVAMNNAVRQLVLRYSAVHKKNISAGHVHLLVDGNRFKSDLPYSYQTVVDGDESILSIACASIVAKVTRDRILRTYDQIFPAYGFKEHKGYPTAQHKEVLKRLGPTLIHRRSFHPNLDFEEQEKI